MKTSAAITLVAAIVAASASSADADKSFLRALQERGTTHRKLASFCGSCNHGTRPWHGWWFGFGACQCDEDWEGACCNILKKCHADSENICSWARLQPKSARSDEVTGDFPLSKEWDALPKQMQGIFWLKDQGDSSSIMSFGKTNDGSYLSTGVYENDADYQYSVRVGGDRSWAFSDKASSWKLVEAIDLVYRFQCDNEGRNNPVACDIHGQSLKLGVTLTAEWLLNFRMVLLKENQKPAALKDVVVWGRPSKVLGFDVDSAYYELTQIVDGDGKKNSGV